MAHIRQVIESRKVAIELVPEANRLDWLRNQVHFEVDGFKPVDEYDMELGAAKQNYLDDLDRKLHKHTTRMFAMEVEHVNSYTDNPSLSIILYFETSLDKSTVLKNFLTLQKLAS